MRRSIDKKLILLLVVFATTSCNLFNQIQKNQFSSKFKTEIYNRFEKEFPNYKVSQILLKQNGDNIIIADIIYEKPSINGVFIVEWKYHFEYKSQEWVLVSKGDEGQLAIKES